MKKSNTNIPLSREELNELLTNSTFSKESLNDFEKEALEGYSEIDSLSKVRKLQDEIDVAISKRVSESDIYVKSRKQVIITWSIAATLLLIMVLSVVLYKSSFFQKESVVAVKEIPLKPELKNQQSSEPLISNNEFESGTVLPTADEKAKVKSPSDNGVSTKKTMPLEEAKAQEQEIQPGNPVSLATSGDVSQDMVVAKKSEQLDDLSKREESFEKLDANKDKKEALSKRKAKEEEADNAMGSGIAASEAKAAAPQSVSEKSRGNGYKNSDKINLKQHILEYYNTNKIDPIELNGTYKIKFSIKSNGQIKSLSVSQLNGDNKAKKHIEEAVKSFNNWSTETRNQKNNKTEEEIEINF